MTFHSTSILLILASTRSKALEVRPKTWRAPRAPPTPTPLGKNNVLRLRPSTDGNLALVEDAWRVVDDDADVAARSPCSVVAEPSRHVGTAFQDSDARAWKVTAKLDVEYRVVEAPGLLDPANDALLWGHLKPGEPRPLGKPRRLVVIDETVDDLYGDGVRAYFEARGVDFEVLRLPMVEEEKTMDLCLEVCAAMKRMDLPRRGAPVVAVGGGVCLDVVGLAATLFRRKTPYVRVPTTTLSYVDASVGAKSGVNFLDSKNRLGAYVPPAAALLDPQFLRTEEPRAVASGVAEMAKMALVKSPELFELLEGHAGRLVADHFAPRDPVADTVPAEVLRISIETMLEELAPNLWETSLDRLVDFGHAFGQELEMHALGTADELTHGEAVNVDMAYMTVLACRLGYLKPAERDRILRVLGSYGCPLWHPLMTREFVKHAAEERIAFSMGLRLPLPTGIGRARIFNDVSVDDCLAAVYEYTVLCGPGARA
mmetsp:Transcript_26518/g.79507  ORF Transcript_26518/g.79507 Transcript_26518/m.79507 type:complete len:485 (-) Transcript_26518:71-1525(-)